MRISIYGSFPKEAKKIRETVFINEQGFQNEFDEIDNEAVHIVLYNEDEVPVATCRVYWNTSMNSYTLGRLAVIEKYRGKNIGSIMLKEAERYVRENDGKNLVLHAQCRVVDFYRKSGFIELGDVENDEGCPHVWMKKSF